MTTWPARPQRARARTRPRRRSLGDGGCSFAIDPDVCAAHTPALWRPDLSPGTVALQSAPAGFSPSAPVDPASLGPVLADRTDKRGRHLVLADPGGRLRLWLPDPAARGSLAILLAPDQDYPLRRAAADRIVRRLHGTSAGALPSAFRPSDFQRGRLALLLRLLDLLASGHSTRALSEAAIYPGLGLHGANWRGANERRQVQRLRDEALHLATAGYLDLLRGR
ncbi:MAG: DUF2285 domain-containing protein [Burkholderiaceae bacterium]